MGIDVAFPTETLNTSSPSVKKSPATERPIVVTPVEFAVVVPESPIKVIGNPFACAPEKSLAVIPEPEKTNVKGVPLGTFVVTTFMDINPYSGTVSLELIE